MSRQLNLPDISSECYVNFSVIIPQTFCQYYFLLLFLFVSRRLKCTLCVLPIYIFHRIDFGLCACAYQCFTWEFVFSVCIYEPWNKKSNDFREMENLSLTNYDSFIVDSANNSTAYSNHNNCIFDLASVSFVDFAIWIIYSREK